jgi:hypothetical protein
MGDYGYVIFMPEMDTLKLRPEDRKLPFKHSDEIARPDYYSVSMDAGRSRRIRTEMTATARCAYMRFTLPTLTRGSYTPCLPAHPAYRQSWR